MVGSLRPRSVAHLRIPAILGNNPQSRLVQGGWGDPRGSLMDDTVRAVDGCMFVALGADRRCLQPGLLLFPISAKSI